MLKMISIASMTAFQILSMNAFANERVIGKGSKACFARTYSDDHLAAHPGQVVSSMVFKLEWKKDQPIPHASLGVHMRGADLSNFMFCPSTTTDGLLKCGVPCDGGSVEVGYSEDGSFYLYNKGVSLDQSCDDRGYFLDDTPENRVFRLEPVPCL